MTGHDALKYPEARRGNLESVTLDERKHPTRTVLLTR